MAVKGTTSLMRPRNAERYGGTVPSDARAARTAGGATGNDDEFKKYSRIARCDARLTGFGAYGKRGSGPEVGG